MLLRTFPQFTLDYVRKRLTSAQGWAYYAWAREHEALVFGERLKRKSKGYIAKEAERIREERKHG